MANVYRVELEGAGGPGRLDLYLVDLPGYGYARGGTDSAVELAGVAEAYFRGNARLKPRATGAPSENARLKPQTPVARRFSAASNAALLLVDSRHPGLEADVHAARWLDSIGVSRYIVATKIDKLSRSERARNLNAIGDTFGTAALPVSAASGEGLDELWKMIVRIARDADRDE